MGEVARRRKLLKQSSKELEKANRRAAFLNRKMDESWEEFHHVMIDKDGGKSLVDNFAEAGFHRYLQQSKELTESVNAFVQDSTGNRRFKLHTEEQLKTFVRSLTNHVRHWFMTTTGDEIWEKVKDGIHKMGFGAWSKDEAAAHEAAEKWGAAAAERGVTMTPQRIAVAETIAGFAAKWAVHAFQRITTTHTYAAALMCSDADRAVLEDIEMQWHAFMVCVPDKLFSYKEEESGLTLEYNRVLIASFDDCAYLLLVNQINPQANNRIVVSIRGSIAELLEADEDRVIDAAGHAGGEITLGRVQRVVVLAKRLVAGLLLSLQNRNNFKSKTYPAKERRNNREHDEPMHRVVMVGAPLKIDCRPQILDYIQNGSHKRKGAPPSVQTLVRGHYRRQVCGVGRTGRKVIWIFPFWRGPDDAPILTRPKAITN